MAKTRVATASIEFTAEDAKFLASLRGIQREGKTTTTSFKELSRETQNVFGVGLEQKANAAAEAIKKVGGATKLTNDEAKKHLATLDQWIIKSKALGREVPDSILSTRSALASVNAEGAKSPGIFQGIGGSAMKMAGAMGLAFSAGAVVSFAKSVIDAAGDIDEMSKSVGLSAEEYQRFKFAAEQGGSSIDAVLTSTKKLSINLSKGGDSVVAALKDAGLAFDVIRQMKPGEAWKTVGEAVEGIQDPMRRAEARAILLGKSADELAATWQAGVDKVGNSTRVMSDDTVARLAAAGDAWAALANTVTIYTGEFLGATMELAANWLATLDRMTSGWKKFAQTVQILGAGSLGGLNELQNAMKVIAALEKAEQDRNKPSDKPKPSGGGPSPDTTTDYVAALSRARAEVDKLSAAQKAGIEAARKMGATTEQITGQFKISEGALRLLTEAKKGSAKAGQSLAEIEKKYADALIPLKAEQKTIIDDLVKRGWAENDIAKKVNVSAEAVRKYVDAQRTLVAIQKEQLAVIPRTKQLFEMGVGIPGKDGLGAFNPDLANQQIPLIPRSSLLSAIGANMGSVFAGMDPSTIAAVSAIGRVRRGEQKPVTSGPSLFQSMFGTSEQLGQHLASTIVGALQGGGNPVAAAGGMVGSSIMSGLAKHLTTAADGTKAVLSGWIGGAANAVLPFVGSLVAPLVDAIFGAFRDKAHEKTNDLRDQFLLQFGPGGTGTTSGFGSLAAQLAKIEGGSAAFKALIDAKTPEAFAKAMERVNAILASTPEAMAKASGFQTKAQLEEAAAAAVKLHAYMRDSGLYTAESVQQAWERAQAALIAAGNENAIAAGKAREEITKLKSELEGLYASVADEAEEEEMGVEETRARGRIAQIEAEIKAREEQLSEEAALRKGNNEKAEQDYRNYTEGRIGIDKMYRDELEDLFGKPIMIPLVPSLTGGVPTSFAARGGFVTDQGVQYRAFGGSIFSKRGTDTVPAMLTPGEFVLNTRAVDLIGADVLSGLNTGRMKVPSSRREPDAGALKPTIVNNENHFEFSNLVVDSRERVDQIATSVAKAIHRGGEVLDSWRRDAMPLLAPGGA